MKKSLSAGIAVFIAFSVTLPSAWAGNAISDDPIFATYIQMWAKRGTSSHGLWEKGPYGKTLISFAKQLNAHTVWKKPDDVRKFYQGLKDKLRISSQKFEAACGTDKGKMAEDFTRFFNTRKAGACSNAMLVKILGSITEEQQQEFENTSGIIEDFEDELGYLNVRFPTGKQMCETDETGGNECFEPESVFFLRTYHKTIWYTSILDSHGVISNCQISELNIPRGSKLSFGNNLQRNRYDDRKLTLSFQPPWFHPSPDAPNFLPSATIRRTIEGTGGINREQALKRWNATSLGKRVFIDSVWSALINVFKDIEDPVVRKEMWEEQIEEGRKIPDDGIVFELVRFNGLSNIWEFGDSTSSGAHNDVNLWILHCNFQIPDEFYPGEI